MFEQILPAFIVGGLICVIAQLFIDLTPFNITPGHILVSYVVSGAVLSGIGLYQPLVDFAGAGATIPLSGFGHLLTQGTLEAIGEKGLLGVFSGGLTNAALGITVAIVTGFTVAILFDPRG